MEIKDSETHYVMESDGLAEVGIHLGLRSNSLDEFSILAKGRSNVVQDVEEDCAVRAECLQCCAGKIHRLVLGIVEVAISLEQCIEREYVRHSEMECCNLAAILARCQRALSSFHFATRFSRWSYILREKKILDKVTVETFFNSNQYQIFRLTV